MSVARQHTGQASRVIHAAPAQGISQNSPVSSIPNPPPSLASDPQPGPAGGRGRILVVDDNSDAAETLSELLGYEGYQSQWVVDAEAALQLLNSDVPDLVLLDIGLPRIDGYQLARLLRADPRAARMKLVALTGYSRDDDRAQALAADFDEHLVKPVSIERLLEVLQQLLQPAA
jgi:CheY-like chemotaxis protein